jgi:hypothetical protein
MTQAFNHWGGGTKLNEEGEDIVKRRYKLFPNDLIPNIKGLSPLPPAKRGKRPSSLPQLSLRKGKRPFSPPLA